MKATGILIFLSIAAVASATSVGTAMFNFNSLAASGSGNTQANIASYEAAIQTYMNGVLTSAGCTGCSVTVTGAYADQLYNADGHVTGPGNAAGGKAAKSLTLGTSDNAAGSSFSSLINSGYDTFLATTNDAATSTGPQITMKFTGFTVNGLVGFNYEIFPDVSCQALTTTACGGNPTTGGIYPNQPDFKFDTGGSTPVTSFFSNGIQYGYTPNGTSPSTNNSPLSTAELSPQNIGTWSGTLSNATELDFIDWPATIGVDNLNITWTTTGGSSPVPDPSSVLLFGTVVAGIALRKRFRKSA